MAGGGGGGQASPGDDSAMNVIWFIVGLFLISILIWMSFEQQLKFAFIKLRQGELIVINFFIQILPLEIINLGHIKQELSDAVFLASNTRADDLSFDVAEYLSLTAGNYLRYPAVLCLIFFSYYRTK